MRLRSFFILLIFWVLMSPVHAFMVLHSNLESLVRDADRIFLGKVLSVDPSQDRDGRSCDFITFEVSEAFKGELGKTVTIKQVSTRPTTLEDGTVVQSTLFRGIPIFKEGEEVLVLLSAGSKIGFTTTVGFDQGKFRAITDEFGQKKLINGTGNWRLFDGMQALSGFKSQGLSASRFQALQSNPKDLYLDQMRTILKALIPNNP